jgi:hypothetical protein
MKWYHFTGIKEFAEALQDEALISLFERSRAEVRKIPVPDDIAARLGPKAFIDDLNAGHERLRQEKPDEYDRMNYVFFTSDNSRPMGERGNDVVLGFELPNQPNKGPFLILPKIGLEHLVDVGVIPTQDLRVKTLLFTAHGGKYHNVQVYQI